MSIIVLAAAALSAAVPTTHATIGRSDWPNVAAAARRMEMPAGILYRALTAPQAPRRLPGEVRYCVPQSLVAQDKPGLVCRNESQWAALGIDIAASLG